MEFNEKKEKLLSQLSKACGIDFEIKDSSLSDDATLDKLSEILTHFNSADTKINFLKSYLSGETSYADASPMLHRYHYNEAGIYQLFYLKSATEYTKEALSLIKSLLINSSDTVVEIDSNHILVLVCFDETPTDEEVNDYASQLQDMLETETYTAYKLAYDKPCHSFKALQTTYKSTLMSMNIGEIFLSAERLYYFPELGLGRLLYNVPIAECTAYLDNYIPVSMLSSLDEETLNTLSAFFDCDLSLAETSRALFVHRNTLIYRLDKFKEQTGLDPRKFSDAITIKISLMLYEYLKSLSHKIKAEL